jgi:pilus assembly protein CpaB
VKNPKAFLIAILLAFLATSAQCRYVKQREVELLQRAELKPVVVATVDIREGQRLDETMFHLVEIPNEYIQPRAVATIDRVLGQISSSPISAGEQLMINKLQRSNDQGLAWEISSHMRAVAINVSDVAGVGGHINPRSRVDVMATFDFGEGDRADLRTVTLFQDVWVLAVGDDIGRPMLIDDAMGGEIVVAEGLNANHTVTLQLTPEDAQRVVLAQELGTLTLSLRGRWETDEEITIEEPANVYNTLGVREQVRQRAARSYGVYGPGGGY